MHKRFRLSDSTCASSRIEDFFSTGCASRIAEDISYNTESESEKVHVRILKRRYVIRYGLSRKTLSRRNSLSTVKKPDLVFSREGPFSTDEKNVQNHDGALLTSCIILVLAYIFRYYLSLFSSVENLVVSRLERYVRQYSYSPSCLTVGPLLLHWITVEHTLALFFRYILSCTYEAEFSVQQNAIQYLQCCVRQHDIKECDKIFPAY